MNHGVQYESRKILSLTCSFFDNFSERIRIFSQILYAYFLFTSMPEHLFILQMF